MTSAQVRQEFINFFVKKGHKHVASSSTIPHDDPSLLFTNAGMNQFKDFFLGTSPAPYPRAVTSQKIIRAGGKHNDLENVGKTPRHHTFFEMLGNFSFGDYFKDTAITYAWEFLTQTLGIDESKLAVSIYKDDEEALELWLKNTTITKDKIAKLDEKDNFWSMGDTGPCGPCSEIHYDLYGPQNKKNQDKKSVIESLEQDDGRFLEIWNLVFMQFNRKKSGELVKLPKPSVDTGMGLERIVSVMQKVTSNYDTDIFLPLIEFIAKKSSYQYGSSPNLDVAVRVIADHIRSSSIIVADGGIPSNEGRGYVLRRIIRRALRHAKYLQQPEETFAECSVFFSRQNEKDFPELFSQKDWIYRILSQEEKRFASTLDKGLKMLNNYLESTKTSKEIKGEVIFKLYDTYGFPMEITEEILEEKNISYNKKGFEKAMEKQKEIARKSQSFNYKEQLKPLLEIQNIYHKSSFKHNFVGYEKEQVSSSIEFAWNEKEQITEVLEGEKFYLLLQETPFYAESGGQVGDTGILKNEDFSIRILNTQKSPIGLNYSFAKLEKAERALSFKEKITFVATIDKNKRKQIISHHTATHLLHSALREVLGMHIKQAGSLVNASKLRLDIQHFETISYQHLMEVEELVNSYIQKNEAVLTESMPLEKAIQKGALAFFGEKYGKEVRVVSAGANSKELCGGCHVKRTGDLGFFKILTESSSAAGVRRIEAVASSAAWDSYQKKEEKIQQINQLLGFATDKIIPLDKSIQFLSKKIQTLEVLEYKNKALENQIRKNFIKEIEKTAQKEQKLLFLENSSILENKDLLEPLLQKFQPCILFLYKKNQQLLEVMLVKQKGFASFHCGNFCKKNIYLIKGKGGGNENFSQCKGENSLGLPNLQKELQKELEKSI